ncbi:Dicer-like protein 1 [Haplosporangium sp. Z 27]|nr:Dicer-like protein 1 [Haplosporangium sp. Z 27]
MADANDLLLFEEEDFSTKRILPVSMSLQVPDLLTDSFQNMRLSSELYPAPTIAPIKPTISHNVTGTMLPITLDSTPSLATLAPTIPALIPSIAPTIPPLIPSIAPSIPALVPTIAPTACPSPIWSSSVRSDVSSPFTPSPTPASSNLSPQVTSSENKDIVQKPKIQYLIPRDYQEEMYRKALETNIISVMDTGSGKTLVAVMLIREMLRLERQANRSFSERKICFFIVPTVPLVSQQATFIRNNSECEVIELSGSRQKKKKDVKLWEDILEKADVVVVTAQILLDLFRHGFVKMSRVHLLVFDECHHARRDHPYCGILREFYHDAPSKERPKIFGMTASPTQDSGSKLFHSANKLERIMDSIIFTVSRNHLQRYIELPSEFVIQYHSSPNYFTTALTTQLQDHCSTIPQLGLAFASEKKDLHLQHLGPWCIDRYWKELVESLARPRNKNIVTDDIKLASNIIKSFQLRPPALTEDDLSPKVLKLIQLLQVAAEGLSNEFCGIVFVQRRDTAISLCLLLQEMEILQGCLRVQVFTGHGDDQEKILRMTQREQQEIIEKFKKGEYNLLISTSVAEEGIDIQPCNLVVRFDPATSSTGYIQSKGRARKRDSRYIIMQEFENRSEEATFEKIRYTDNAMREWYQGLDPDRELWSPTDAEDVYAADLTLTQSFKVNTTGALLTLDSAVPLLHYYCSTLATDEYSMIQPELNIFPSGSFFVCDLTLPANAPFRTIQSDLASTKAIAKKSAAFKACEELHKRGALDDHLLPVSYSRAEEESFEAEAVVDAKDKNNQYPMSSPKFWKSEPTISTKGAQLYGCVIEFIENDLQRLGGKHRYRTMCLLTYQRLPCTFEPFNLYVEGAARHIVMSNILAEVYLERDQLESLRNFTLSIFQRICRKTFECSLQDMPYFIAPLTRGYHKDQDSEVKISWEDVALGQPNSLPPNTEVSRDDKSILENVLTFRNDPNRDFFVREILQGQRVHDIMPQDRFKNELKSWDDAIAKGKASAPEPISGFSDLEAKSTSRTFAQYFKYKYNADCPDDDIILLVDRVRKMRNHLQPATREEDRRDEGTTAILPLSASVRCPVCADVLRMTQLVPSVLYNLESTLLVQEVREKLGLENTRLDYLQVAFTTAAANRDFHYERLETLGDSFLKFSSTIRLYIVNPAKDEGQLHSHRIRIISNRALLRHAIDLGLFQYVNSTPFHRRSWRPTRFIVDGKKWNESQSQELSNKTLADVIEASLGAAYLSGGVRVGFMAAKALLIPFDEFKDWDDFYNVYINSKVTRDAANDRSKVGLTPLLLAGVSEVEKTLGYRFKDPLLFFEAMTHASYIREDSVCYQRLEFLGDAILDFQVIQYYYQKYPDAPPGAITIIKDASVNNAILGAISLRWGLQKYLNHSSQALNPAIERAMMSIEQKRSKSATRSLDGEYWNDISMPKVLGDLVESTLGAVFVDSGFNFDVVKDLFWRLIRPFLDDHVNFESIIIHPNKLLLEGLQAAGCNNFRFENISPQGDKIDVLRKLGLGRTSQQKDENNTTLKCNFWIHDEIVSTATGDYIDDLRKEVSIETLAKIKSDPGLLSRLCDCPKRRGPRHVSMLDQYRQG